MQVRAQLAKGGRGLRCVSGDGDVTHNVGNGTTDKYGTWTLGLESGYLWENNFCFETQNDVVMYIIQAFLVIAYLNKFVTLS